jgi:DNA-binding SARP family transcriptional activator
MRGDGSEGLRFEVLGPMRVADEEQSRPVVGARQRIVLGALLERANQPVSAGKLVEVVWDGAPPDRAAPTLRTYMVRLRRDLGPRAGARILTKDNGYVAQVEEHELDALLFEAHCRRADAAASAGDWPRVAEAAENALALWRGTPLVDVPSKFLHEAWLPRLEQWWLQAREWQAEAALRLGRSEQLIQPLRELTAAHPLRERFHAQLMLALYRAGRQAEALAAYRDARQVLVETLGIEPGTELRSLHARILSGEVEPAPAPAQPLVDENPARQSAQGSAQEPAQQSTSPVARTAPRQLPASAQHFTGRQVEMDLLVDQLGPLAQRADSAGAIVISAIDGMAGIGKTALAVHAAHRLAERFPDGQLFLDLHGYTQGHPARTAGEALTWLLQSLGVPPARIPTDGEQAAALYRQRLADTRTLIVLDNAATEAQVRPLLPGAGSCLVLVTSRRRLKGLDDAHILSLGLLSPPDAVALLSKVTGPDRISPDDPLAGEVAELCGYLPLALRIAASLLRHRPAWGLEQLAGQLRDQHRRMSALSDGERGLPAVFDLSYASLDASHRLLWRRLGLIPGPDLDAYAAAALIESGPAHAAGLLEDLVDHNLLGTYPPGRYRLHDLLRSHARTLAAADSAPERAAAVDRLLHYYAHTAQSASVLISRYPRPAPDGSKPTHTPALPDPDAARAWLRTEQSTLEAAFTHAHTSGLDRHTIALAAGLAEILQIDGPWIRALQIHQAAAETAERSEHSAAHATALTDLGRVRPQIGDYPGARDVLTLALELYRALGDRLGEAGALTDLGRVRVLTGDYPGAGDFLTRALELYRALGNRLGEAGALTDLGRVRLQTGDHPAADDAHTRVLELYRTLGNRNGEAIALADLGRVRHQAGDYPGADDVLTQALDLYRTLGNRLGEAGALNDLGRVRFLTGDHPGADSAHTQALELYRALGNRNGEAGALNNLGRVRHQAGDYRGADDAHTQALEAYRALGNRLGEAFVLTSLGRLRHQIGDYPGAEDVHTRALELYRELGNRSNEAWALNHYAATLAAAGRRTRALALYQQALTMNQELNKPDDEAIAHEGLGECHLSAGDTENGVSRLMAALTIYQRLGMVSDADRVHTRLAELAEPAKPADPARSAPQGA